MATGHKTYYLVKDSQFWEIRVKGRETVIRGGKVGCKGRLFPGKEHATPAKALQFAQSQVNAKIILGFETVEEDKTPRPSSSQNLKRSQSNISTKTLSSRPKQPPKKRETIRRLVQQKSLRSQEHSQATNGNTVAEKTSPTWRKPPKKQTTIRRLARRESSLRQKQEQLSKRKSMTPRGMAPKQYPKRQLFSASSSSSAAAAGKAASQPPRLTRQASRRNLLQPQTLGTLTFLEKSPTLPIDLKVPADKETDESSKDSMPLLTREDTIKVERCKPKAELKPAPSLTVGVGGVYIPPANSWPMQLSAPVLWTEQSISEVCANAVFVDETMCIYGDDNGKVVHLNTKGQIQQTYQLHTKVRCILQQEGYLYVGCTDGVIYEISSGTPYQMYRPPSSSFQEVQGLVLYNNVLVTSNVKGQLCAVDHDGKVLWRKKSMGDGGWMLCADESGVYHGHCGGVTKYLLHDGTQLWYRKWTASIFGVVQSEMYLYVADNVRIKKLRKDTGAHEKTYAHKGSGCIMSVAMGGGLVFAAGSACITCYEETSAQVVYRLLNGGQPLGLQYHLGRLYCVGSGGLSVIDLSESSIKQTKEGKQRLHKLPSGSSRSISPLMKLSSLSQQASETATLNRNVTLTCVKDTIPKVKPDSEHFSCALSVEFPVNIRRVGAKYVVNDLKASNTGGFYRLVGEIYELEEEKL